MSPLVTKGWWLQSSKILKIPLCVFKIYLFIWDEKKNLDFVISLIIKIDINFFLGKQKSVQGMGQPLCT